MNDIARHGEVRRDQPMEPVDGASGFLQNRTWGSGSEELDRFGFLDVWLFLRRRQFLIAFFFLSMCAVGVMAVMERPSVYRATAKVMVAPDDRQIISSDGGSGRPAVDADAVNSQVEVLRSTDLAVGVVRQIDFAALVPPPQEGLMTQVRQQIRALVGLVGGTEEESTGAAEAAALAPLPGQHDLSDEELTVIDRFRRMMSVRPVQDSAVLDVHFDHPDPRIAAYVANQIVDYYVEMLRVQRVSDANESLGWARERLYEVQRELEEVRRSMAEAVLTGGVGEGSDPDAPPPLDQEMIENQLIETTQNLSAAQDELLALQARSRSARQALDQGLYLSALELAGSTSILQRLRDDEAEARRLMAEAQATFSSRHPSYLNAAIELQSVINQTEAEAQAFVAAMEDAVASAEQRVSLIQARVNELTRQNRESIQAEIPLRTLEASEQVGQTLYELLRTRADLIQGELGLALADARVVSRAIQPSRPISPSRAVTMAAVIFVSLSASIGIALGVEMTRAGYQSTSEVLRDVTVRSAGIIPLAERVIWPLRFFYQRSLMRGKPSRYSRRSQHTIALQSLLYSIRSCAEDRSPAWAALVSADTGEGKSVTAITLGQMAALSGRRTLVVNGDLRRADLARQVVGPVPPVFTSEIPIGTGRDLELRLYRDQRTGLDILDIAIKDLFDISKTLETLPDIVAGLPDSYALVVVDTPPLAAYPDGLMVGRFVDVVVCLVLWRKTPRNMVRYVVGQLQGLGQRSIIVTLNKVRLGRYKLVNSNDSRLFSRAQLYEV